MHTPMAILSSAQIPHQAANPKSDLEFAGKVALITGGTRGIGAATARRVAELGAKVLITGRRQHEGRLLVDEVKRSCRCAAFIKADVSQPEEVRLLVPFTVETYGRLDYAFNNAGMSRDSRLLVDQTVENFDRVFGVNVKACSCYFKMRRSS